MRRTNEDLQSGCLLPLAQAIITGALIFLISLGGLFYLKHESPGVFWASTTLGALAAFFSWMSGVRQWQRAVFKIEESTFPEDKSFQEKPVVRVELSDPETRSIKLIDLPASLDQLQVLAAGLLAGQTLSESAWTGSGGIFTRAEFAALRGELIRRGLATWNSPGTPARGVSLTRGGLAAMRVFALKVDSPTPTIRKTK